MTSRAYPRAYSSLLYIRSYLVKIASYATERSKSVSPLGSSAPDLIPAFTSPHPPLLYLLPKLLESSCQAEHILKTHPCSRVMMKKERASTSRREWVSEIGTGKAASRRHFTTINTVWRDRMEAREDLEKTNFRLIQGSPPLGRVSIGVYADFFSSWWE